MIDRKKVVERMDKTKARYTPLEETDEGDIAFKVMLGGTLFVLVMVIAILRLGGG